MDLYFGLKNWRHEEGRECNRNGILRFISFLSPSKKGRETILAYHPCRLMNDIFITYCLACCDFQLEDTACTIS